MIIDTSRRRVEELYREFEAAKQGEKQKKTQRKKNGLRLVHRKDDLAKVIQQSASVQYSSQSQDAKTLQERTPLQDETPLQNEIRLQNTTGLRDVTRLQDVTPSQDTTPVQDLTLLDKAPLQDNVSHGAPVRDGKQLQDTAVSQGGISLQDATLSQGATLLEEAMSSRDSKRLQEETGLKDVAVRRHDAVTTETTVDRPIFTPGKPVSVVSEPVAPSSVSNSAEEEQSDSRHEELSSEVFAANEWVDSNQFELIKNLVSLMSVIGNSIDSMNTVGTEIQKQDEHSERMAQATVHARTGNSTDGSLRDIFDFFNSDTLKVLSEYATREYITAEEYLAIHSLPFDSNVLLVLLGVREYVGEPTASYISTFLRVLNAVDLVTSGEIHEVLKLFSERT